MADRSDGINVAEILEGLDNLEDLLLQCRALFPVLGHELIGKCHFSTAPYYMSRGYAAQIHLNEPITTEFIDRNNTLGKWINENTLIRLHGILEYHCLFRPKIHKELPGWREMDLLRRMRNAFTKTPLNYHPNAKKENVRLREEVIQHFDLKEQEYLEGEIPTPIDSLVVPIIRACREYVTAYAASRGQRSADLDTDD